MRDPIQVRTHAIAPFPKCLPILMLMLGAAAISAQTALPGRMVHVSVTDPMNRFVTGLDRENFEIVADGVRRPITGFSSVDTPISVAIVTDVPTRAVSELTGPADELIQAQSLPDALRRLAVSKNPRKALVVTSAVDMGQIPDGIQVLQAAPGAVQRAVVQLRNQYIVRYESPDLSARVEVVVKQPRGMPLLKPNWK